MLVVVFDFLRIQRHIVQHLSERARFESPTRQSLFGGRLRFWISFPGLITYPEYKLIQEDELTVAYRTNGAPYHLMD